MSKLTHQRDYIERYGHIPHGKSQIWNDPRPGKPGKVQPLINYCYYVVAQENAEKEDWTSQEYPGRGWIYACGDFAIETCLSNAVALQEVRGGIIEEWPDLDELRKKVA